jgi:hypothetical protein
MSTPRRGLTLLCAALLAGSLAAQEPLPLPPEPPGGWPRIDTVLGPRPFTAPEPDHTTLWVAPDFLLGWVQPVATPIPLLTTGPATRTPPAGVLGNSGVRPVIDGHGLAGGERGGVQIRAGMWLTDDTTVGAEARFFALTPTANALEVSSPGSPVLARPFLDTTSRNSPAAALVAFSAPGNPLQQSGGFAFRYVSRLWGGDIGSAFNLVRDDCLLLDLLPAFRFLQLREDFEMGELTRYAPRSGTRLDGSTLQILDVFRGRTEFFGYSAGARVGYRLGDFSALLTGRLDGGVSNGTTTIVGRTRTISPAGTATVASGGVLALASNSGTFSRDWFGFIPEGDFRLAYRIRPNLELTFGYTVLYWTDVSRPARQIEPQINFRQAPSFPTTVTSVGTLLPINNDIRRSDFWMQALSWGVEWRY